MGDKSSHSMEPLKPWTTPGLKHMKKTAEYLVAGNQHKRPLVIRIMQRVYPGSPRWDEATASHLTHTKKETNLDHSCMDRVPEVVSKIRAAWGPDKDKRTQGQTANDASNVQKFRKRAFYLNTCINPVCKERTQELGQLHQRNHTICESCKLPTEDQLCVPIKNKWLYIIRGGVPEGSRLTNAKLLEEVFVKDEHTWHVYPQKDVGSAKKDFAVEYQDGFYVVSAQGNDPYQFFLSPARLSEPAREKLLQAAGRPARGPSIKGQPGYGSMEHLVDVTVQGQARLWKHGAVGRCHRSA